MKDGGLKAVYIMCKLYLNYDNQTFDFCEIGDLCGYSHQRNFSRQILKKLEAEDVIKFHSFKKNPNTGHAVKSYTISKDKLLQILKNDEVFKQVYLVIRSYIIGHKFGVMEPELYDSKMSG